MQRDSDRGRFPENKRRGERDLDSVTLSCAPGLWPRTGWINTDADWMPFVLRRPPAADD